jgi:hypothetical protein
VFFLAVKWIGNVGAHSNLELTTADVLEAADFLEQGFKLLYDKSDIMLRRKAEAINKARKPVRNHARA